MVESDGSSIFTKRFVNMKREIGFRLNKFVFKMTAFILADWTTRIQIDFSRKTIRTHTMPKMTG